jgi:hypothetical protein
VSTLHIVAVGARGGDSLGGRGGSGAQVAADVPVTGGATLYVDVGIGGGARGSGAGGNGGGESDVRTCSAAANCGTLGSGQDPRRVVAGGGGGAGAAGAGGSGGDAGTCPTGANGTAGSTSNGNNGGGGGGGNCSQGGPGGNGGLGRGTPGGKGGPAVGGAGGTSGQGAGGGGAGYFGGGGGGSDADPEAGNSGGGGGGSSFVEPGASNVSMTSASTGSSSVTISYAQPTSPTPTPTATPTAPAGKVTAQITGCSAQGDHVYACALQVRLEMPLPVDTVFSVDIGGAVFDNPSGGDRPEVSASPGCAYPPLPSPYLATGDRSQRELRELTRYRTSLVRERTAARNRIQKTLEGASIKLGDVASDVFGASGRGLAGCS